MATKPATRGFGLSPDTPLHYPTIHQRQRSNSIDSDQSQMSGYYYPTYSPPEEAGYDFNNHPYPTQAGDSHAGYPAFTAPQPAQSHLVQQTQPYHDPSHYYQAGQPYPAQQHAPQQQYQYPMEQPQAWSPAPVPQSYPYQTQDLSTFPQFSTPMGYQANVPSSAQFELPAGYLSPKDSSVVRTHRSTSLLSEASSMPSPTQSEASRCPSPNASEMARWGVRNSGGSWSCAYPGCTSRSTFNRGCDLRKHYKRHTKSLFCRVDGCPQATEGGFSSKKDRARHEAKHNPSIVCEWEGCDRLFSRQDNMKDHVRRVHKRRAQ